jgi:hypothetical protein
MGIIFRNKQQKLGRENSHFKFVDWDSVVPEQSRFSRQHVEDLCYHGPRIVGKGLNEDDPYFNFNSESLDTLRLTNNPIDFKDGCFALVGVFHQQKFNK